MPDPGLLLLVVGAVLLAGVAAAWAATRLGVPVLIAFLGLGMLLGSDGPGGIEFDDPELARTAGVIGLAIILFEGGLTTPWRAIRPVLVPAALLSTVGVAVTAAVTAVAARLLFDVSWLAAFLLGTVVATTDAAAVFATLRFTRLRRRLARVLEAESGFNDPLAVALTIGLVEWLQDPAFGAHDVVLLVLRELALGLAVGLVFGWIASAAFARIPPVVAPFAPVASLAAAAFSFGGADVVGGSGFLAVYVVGLWLGNTATPLRRSLAAFHQGVAFLAQIGLFIVLGLFVFPSRLPDVVLPGLALSAVLILVARPLAVWVSTLFQGFSAPERALLGWAGLRGAIPVVLATFPQSAGVSASETIFNAVFFVVVVSALVQGPTLEPLARRLSVISRAPAHYEPPLEVAAVASLGSGLLEFVARDGTAIVGRHVRDLGLPRDALVAVISRGDEALPPRGSTVIERDDRLYVVARRESRRRVEQLFAEWSAG